MTIEPDSIIHVLYERTSSPNIFWACPGSATVQSRALSVQIGGKKTAAQAGRAASPGESRTGQLETRGRAASLVIRNRRSATVGWWRRCAG